ncbi:hypothetical protein DXA96_01400 [Lachnospiraceae bacterium OF09-33XD]|nr:hypothetical protein DXA96_01400 [Lachnospiraceae bacterium OF09-33XD]
MYGAIREIRVVPRRMMNQSSVSCSNAEMEDFFVRQEIRKDFLSDKKPSGQDRTAAEWNYVAKCNPPQAESPASRTLCSYPREHVKRWKERI